MVREEVTRSFIYMGLVCLVGVLALSAAAITPWVSLGIVLSALSLLQMALALKTRVPFLHLMSFSYLLMFFIASLALYFFPPYKYYDIGHQRYPIYLSYVVPACAALYGGLTLGTRGLRPVPYDPINVEKDAPAWSRWSAALCIFGLVLYLLLPLLPVPGSLQFLLELLASLRWVGLFALILSGKRKWAIYAAAIMGATVLSAARTGMFGDVLLWGQCLFLIFCYQRRWRTRAVISIVTALAFMMVFQSIKAQFRQQSANQNSIADRFFLMEDLLSKRVDGSEGLSNGGTLSSTLVRFNQGWIVDRVMRRVPETHGYAYGSTIVDGIEAALLPRVLAPDKLEASNRSVFRQFTGLRLEKSTTMTVSTIGELYANFGTIGGAAAMFFFGLGVAMLYRWLNNRAARNPVWWAWGPFVGFWILKPEEDLASIENWILKSVIVMSIIVVAARRLERGQRERAGARHDGPIVSEWTPASPPNAS